MINQSQPEQHPAVEFDREWDRLPLDELRQLDAVCDRFEQALARDQEAKIESFLVDLKESQQGMVVRELVQIEIETLYAKGQRPVADEYARRFPQWADELRPVVAQAVEDLGTKKSPHPVVPIRST